MSTAATSRRGRASDNRRLSVKARPWRETGDVTEGVGRLIRAVGRRVADEDLDALDRLRELDGALTEAWQTAIEGLRAAYSDRAIGKQLGITKQAVQKRWPRTGRREEQEGSAP